MAEKSFYEILGVSPTATIDEVRAAYERLSAKPEQSAAVPEAFQTLSDPLKRAKYDMSLEVREKPASEQVQAIEPSWTGPAITTLVVALALGAGFYYYDRQVEARQEAEKTAAEAAAARAKQAEERIRATDLETRQREAARQYEQKVAVDESFRSIEKSRRRDEAEKRAQIEKARKKEIEERMESQKKFMDSISDLVSNSPVTITRGK